MAFSIISRPSGTPGMPGMPNQLDPAAQLAQDKMYGATEGRAQELKDDPVQKSVMDYLQGVVGGGNVPYTDEVKNSMLAQQGRGSADAEAAQMESLRQSLGASGGSIYDPGYQAAQRQAMSQRQGQNLDAMGQLNAKAGLENHKAQMQGAAQLASSRNAQNAQINQMSTAGANLRAQTQVPVDPQQQQRRINNPLAHAGDPNGNNGVSASNYAAFRI